MALMNCPECGKEISDQVKACPYCGYPLKKTAPWKIVVPVAAAVCLCVGGTALYRHFVVEPGKTYDRALSLYDQGNYDAAARYFSRIPRYKDVADYMSEIETEQTYRQAVSYMEEGNLQQADSMLASIDGFKDSSELRAKISEEMTYQEAETLYEEGDFQGAREKLEEVSDTAKTQELSSRIDEAESVCSEATALYEEGKFEEALEMLDSTGKSAKAEELKEEITSVQEVYQNAEDLFAQGRYSGAKELLSQISDYGKAVDLLNEITANEAENAYIDNIKAYVFDAETGANLAGRMQESLLEVARNAAWEKENWFTDSYTKGDDGRFLDPGEAQKRFAQSPAFSEALEELAKNREIVTEKYAALDAVPSGMEDLYGDIQLLHNAYRDMTDPAAYTGDISGRLTYETVSLKNNLEKYENLLQGIKDAIPAKHPVADEEETAHVYDFRGVDFDMTAEEVIRAEEDLFGLAPDWQDDTLIGYNGVESGDGTYHDIIYSFDNTGRLHDIWELTGDGTADYIRISKDALGNVVKVPGFAANSQEEQETEDLLPIEEAYSEAESEEFGLLPIEEAYTEAQSEETGLLQIEEAYTEAQSEEAGLLQIEEAYTEAQSEESGLLQIEEAYTEAQSEETGLLQIEEAYTEAQSEEAGLLQIGEAYTEAQSEEFGLLQIEEAYTEAQSEEAGLLQAEEAYTEAQSEETARASLIFADETVLEETLTEAQSEAAGLLQAEEVQEGLTEVQSEADGLLMIEEVYTEAESEATDLLMIEEAYTEAQSEETPKASLIFADETAAEEETEQTELTGETEALSEGALIPETDTEEGKAVLIIAGRNDDAGQEPNKQAGDETKEMPGLGELPINGTPHLFEYGNTPRG